MDQDDSGVNRRVQAGKDKFPMIVGVICGFICAALLTYLMSWYTFQGKAVARVDGKPIRYAEFTAALGKAHGREVLDFLVEKKLVEEAAKRRSIKVDEREIEAKFQEVKKPYSSETDFERFLKQGHLTVTDIKDRIYLQLLAEKLVGEVRVEPKELREFYEQFKDLQYNNQPYDKVKQQVKRDYMAFTRARLVPQAIQRLKEKAKIIYYW
ncbi:MAG: hypothetical protein AB1510_08865 [Bacillota bacterium]